MRILIAVFACLLLFSCDIELHPREPLYPRIPAAYRTLDYCAHFTCYEYTSYVVRNGVRTLYVEDVIDYCCRYSSGEYFCIEDVQDDYYSDSWVFYEYPCQY